MQSASSFAQRPCYELRFELLFGRGSGFAFPCDVRGRVELDSLGERARNNYLFARTLVGRDFSTPVVCADVRPDDRSISLS